MAVVDSQYLYDLIDRAVSAVAGVTTGDNGVDEKTTGFTGTESVAILDGSELKFAALAAIFADLGATAETDPVFTASDAFAITSAQISNWDTAYGWGDHAGLYSVVGHDHSGTYQPASATLDAVAAGTYAGDDSIVTVGTLSAGSVPWSLLSGVPGTFAPAAHTHPASEITAGTFGAGDYAITGGLTLTKTTTPLSVRYDASNRLDVAISSAGVATLTPTGGELDLSGWLNATSTSSANAFGRGLYAERFFDGATLNGGRAQAGGSFFASTVSPWAGNASAGKMVGVSAEAYLEGSGSVGTAAGVEGGARLFGTVAITDADGLTGHVTTSDTPTVGTARSVRAYLTLTGATVTTAVGVDVEAATGSATTLYGVKVAAQTAGATNYGVWTAQAAAATSWAAYHSGTAKSHFGGNVLIGGTTDITTGTRSIGLFSGVAPAGVAADSIALYSVDVAAGSTTLGLWTEGTGCVTANGNFVLNVNGSPRYLWQSATDDAHGVSFDGLTDVTITTQALGDLVYASSGSAWVNLAGNTTVTKKFLRQTGNGSVSAAPAWDTLIAADIPDLSGTYSILAHGHAASAITAGTFAAGNFAFQGAISAATTLTVPKIIGGSGTTQTLTYQTTTGVGATGARHIFLVGNNGATEAMTILNSGRVGIGTDTPGSSFDVAGVSSWGVTATKGTLSYDTGRLLIGASSASTDIVFVRNNNTELARITSTGNVGIGTASPTGKLNVLITTEQLRLSYDISNYAAFTVGATGDLTIAPSGLDVALTGRLAIQGTDTSALTDLLINPSAKTSGYLLDVQIANVSLFRIDYSGNTFAARFDAPNMGVTNLFSDAGNNNIVNIGNTRTYSTAIAAVSLAATSFLGGTGIAQTAVRVSPTYNQTSTAGATDLLINRTETAVGSGAQRLFDAQVGTVSKFSVSNIANVMIGGATQPTTAVSSLSLFSGTAPTAVAADSLAIYSSDLSVGNTIPSIWTEGTAITTAAGNIVARVNGTLQYFHANTADVKPGVEYGGIRVTNGVTAQTGVTTSPVLLTAFATNGLASANITPDQANDRITVNHTGTYLVALNASFSGSANSVVQMHVRVDGVEETIGFARKIGTGGDTGSASCAGIINITTGSHVTIYVETDNAGAGDSITVNHANFTVVEL